MEPLTNWNSQQIYNLLNEADCTNSLFSCHTFTKNEISTTCVHVLHRVIELAQNRNERPQLHYVVHLLIAQTLVEKSSPTLWTRINHFFHDQGHLKKDLRELVNQHFTDSTKNILLEELESAKKIRGLKKYHLSHTENQNLFTLMTVREKSGLPPSSAITSLMHKLSREETISHCIFLKLCAIQDLSLIKVIGEIALPFLNIDSTLKHSFTTMLSNPESPKKAKKLLLTLFNENKNEIKFQFSQFQEKLFKYYIHSIVDQFLTPYITGLITRESEPKERTPLITILISNLQNSRKIKHKTIERIALQRYVHYGTIGIYIHYPEIKTITPKSPKFTELVKALEEGLAKDFPSLILSRQKIREMATQELGTYNAKKQRK